MEWDTLYGPHRHCRGYGKPCARGSLVQNGSSRGQPRAWCHACDARVVVRDGPAYDGLEAEPVTCATAVRALAEGHARRATARIVPVDTETVCPWRPRVACHGRPVMRYGWHDRPGRACPREAWWRVVPPQAARLPGATIDSATAGDAWVWSAVAPGWRVVLACVIGTRDPAGAEGLRARVAPVTADSRPGCTSAPWPAYRHAWRHTDGAWSHPPRQGHRGASPQARRRPPPGLRYAQGVNRRTGGRMVDVRPPVVVGPPAAVAARLAHSPVSWTVQTSGVERDHRTPRPRHRRFTRRTHGCSKDLTWFETPRWWSLAYDHGV